jgi:hypothetical protein
MGLKLCFKGRAGPPPGVLLVRRDAEEVLLGTQFCLLPLLVQKYKYWLGTHLHRLLTRARALSLSLSPPPTPHATIARVTVVGDDTQRKSESD